MTDVEVHSEVEPAYKRQSHRLPLRTSGGAWGRQRVRLGMPMRELERRSGVNRWILSLAEQGRLTPTGEEYEAVNAVLAAEETRQREATGEPSVAGAAPGTGTT